MPEGVLGDAWGLALLAQPFTLSPFVNDATWRLATSTKSPALRPAQTRPGYCDGDSFPFQPAWDRRNMFTGSRNSQEGILHRESPHEPDTAWRAVRASRTERLVDPRCPHPQDQLRRFHHHTTFCGAYRTRVPSTYTRCLPPTVSSSRTTGMPPRRRPCVRFHGQHFAGHARLGGPCRGHDLHINVAAIHGDSRVMAPPYGFCSFGERFGDERGRKPSRRSCCRRWRGARRFSVSSKLPPSGMRDT